MPFKTILLHQYLVWGEENVKTTTSSVRIQLHGIEGDKAIPEIVFYGKKVGTGPATPPTPGAKPIAGVSDKINLCGFHWTPMDKMKPFKMKRDFQMALWTWPAEGFSPQPLYGAQSATVLGYDDYFAEAKAQGLEIVPCVNETPEWFWNMPEAPAMYTTTSIDLPYYNPKLSLIAALDTNGPPVPVAYSNNVHPKTLPCGTGGQRDDPTSYLEYARFMFQYSARYGRQKWDDNILEVNETELWPNYPINQKKSGLDLLKYIEPWNEPDAWWLNSDVYATPEQFAAFLSACYDGHGGTMGYGVGIKEADSTMMVVMPGLTGPDKKYLERMVTWFRKNRPKGDLAFDIANFHHYSNVGNIAGIWPPRSWTAGAPADCDKAWIDVANFVNYAKSLGVPVWWSEMGYDSKPPSWQYAVPYGAVTSDQLQADWLVRNYLMGIRAGIDQIFMFNAINEPGAPNGGLYQNSGLLYGAGDLAPFTPKPAYNSVVNLINELEGYSYVKDESLGDGVMMLKFQGPKRSQVKYVAWMATMDGASKTVRVNGTRYNITETPTFITSPKARQVLINPNWIEKNKVIGQRPTKPTKPK